MATSYIGMDVDSKMVDLAVERDQRIVQRERLPLGIRSIAEFLQSIQGRKELMFEEGPLAWWLATHLRPFVDRLVVCDPRRNRLITHDGDADDVIDAQKLAELLRGGYLREVYQSEDAGRVEFKRWVALYLDRVREAVRQVNKIRNRCRMYGLRPARGAIKNGAAREQWLASLKDHPAVEPLRLLWLGYDACRQQVAKARYQMERCSRKYPIIAAWQELVGVGPVRAAVLFAYLDTPWRFGGNARQLWKYCGVGLEHAGSGKDRDGRPKEGRLKLAWRVNRKLKSAILGAAQNAIAQGDNVFAEHYQRLRAQGADAGNAWHGVARKMLTVLWGMWKTQTHFDPRWVTAPGSAPRRSFGPNPHAEAAPAARRPHQPRGREKHMR